MYARFSETKEPTLATGTNAQSGSAYESIGQMKADMADLDMQQIVHLKNGCRQSFR